MGPGHLFCRNPFHKGVEILKTGVLDDYFTAAVVVLDCDFEAESALQALLGVANVRVDRRRRFGSFLCLTAGVDQFLDEALRLANR